jgi:hypothetical protein
MAAMFAFFSHPSVSRKLRIRLGIFLLISIVIAAIIVRDVVIGDLAWWLAALGIIVGVAAGTPLGRLLTIKWHETEEHAFSEMDIAGGIGIALYIALEVSRNWLLGHWVSGVALSTLSLAFLAGALFGRYLGIRISVSRVLDENLPR